MNRVYTVQETPPTRTMTQTPQPENTSGYGLEAKVRALSDPANYPEAPRTLEAHETHMSWVFLTEHHAYKLKKPVRYDFLDFSTLEKRHADCEAEVRLNRRFAPDVYLGVVALTVDANGSLRLDGNGKPIEWLVKMRRLPAVHMLDQRIRAGHLDNAEIRQVARRLAEIYRQCEPQTFAAGAYRARFAAAIELNRRELARPEFDLPSAAMAAAHAAQVDFLAHDAALLDARVASNRIVEGHGDLRPEHVCLEPVPVIIDCLEFNREFRIVDPADELAFLAMECASLGAPDAGELLASTCLAAMGDQPPARLVTFYKLFRAMMRARLAIWHLHELQPKDWTKWRQSAQTYLALAEAYARELTARG
jgi:aminoglycoside phosphotransferase family enzyme